MQIANMIYDFFGFSNISQSATFIDLLDTVIKIGVGLWVTIFIIRSMMMVLRVPEKGF